MVGIFYGNVLSISLLLLPRSVVGPGRRIGERIAWPLCKTTAAPITVEWGSPVGQVKATRDDTNRCVTYGVRESASVYYRA